MNDDEFRAFAEQTKRTKGAIVASDCVVSQSLLDDPGFDPAPYLADQAERAARAFYDRPDCEYHYLSPAEYDYSPGPFAYRRTPGDLPEGAVLIIGRVRVTRKAN